MPRHSPCALFSLTSSEETLYHSLPPSSPRLPSKAHSFRSSSSPIKTRFAGLLFGLVVFLPTSIRRKSISGFSISSELCRLIKKFSFSWNCINYPKIFLSLLLPSHNFSSFFVQFSRYICVRRNFISFASAFKLTLPVESSLIPFFFLPKFDPLRWVRIWSRLSLKRLNEVSIMIEASFNLLEGISSFLLF